LDVAKECIEPGTTKTKLIMLTRRKKLRRASGPIFDNNIVNLTTLVALFLFYFSEIIPEIFGLLINPILWVCFFVVNMFPLVKSMIYLFLMLFFHVV
jgi:hypothetical protein